MTIIFTCKILEGYTIKILAELLHHNIKNACLVIKQEGIFFRTVDTNKTILLDFVLNSCYFKKFKLNRDQITIGLTMNFFYDALQNIKKSEFVKFTIDDKDETDFIIQFGSNSKTMTTVIKSQQIQSLDISLPDGYKSCIPIPHQEFQKMLKNITKTGNTITIKIKKTKIQFLSDSAGIIKKDVEFGDSDSDSEKSDEDGASGCSHSEKSDCDKVDYCEEFDSKQLNKIAKISNLTKNFIEIYTMKDRPLLLKTTIGGIGDISIFIKTKHQQNCESMTKDED